MHKSKLFSSFPYSACRFLDDNQLSPGSNGSTLMNPGSNNGANTSWLFSGPNSGGGFHTPDHGLHGGHVPGSGQPSLPPTSNATFTPTSAFEDGRGGPQPPMIVPFSQTDLNFVDSLSIHPSQQKNQQQQTQHFVTTSTLHPSSLSVVEATDATGKTAECIHLE